MIRTLPPFLLQNFVWPVVRPLLLIFARFEIRGLEHLKALRGPIIFAGNHMGEVDVVLVPAALPFLSRFSPIFYVAKQREFYEKKGMVALLYGGAFFKLWGAYPVREGLKNYASSLGTHLEILNKKRSLLIFPEGGVSPDGTIRPAHGGVAFLSRAAGAPIIPVAIKSTKNFSWRGFFAGRFRFSITFGAPIRPENLFTDRSEPDVETYREAAGKTMEQVESLLA